jgi:hypothetical protein
MYQRIHVRTYFMHGVKLTTNIFLRGSNLDVNPITELPANIFSETPGLRAMYVEHLPCHLEAHAQFSPRVPPSESPSDSD